MSYDWWGFFLHVLPSFRHSETELEWLIQKTYDVFKSEDLMIAYIFYSTWFPLLEVKMLPNLKR